MVKMGIAGACILLLTALGSTPAAAVTADLRKAANLYDQAQVSGSRPLLEQLLADDYVLFNSAGTVETKGQFIADLTDPAYHLSPYVVRSPIERQWSSGAVLAGVTRLKGADHGQPFDACLSFADIWTKRHGRWQVIYTQVGRAKPEACQ